MFRQSQNATVRARISLAVAFATETAALLVSVPARTAASPHLIRATQAPISVAVLSSRPDLISGGSALVAIRLPAGVKRAVVTVGARNVSRSFSIRSNHRYEGLVTGLKVGRNVLRARVAHVGVAQLVLTNYPESGPMFAGPQLKPWKCQATAVNKKTCAQPVAYTYQYISSNPLRSGFQSYNPKAPATDVATTRTDTGRTVPFIIRNEVGYIDRDQYRISTLWQPGKRWTPFAPQPTFNHKLLISHGASCGADHTTGSAPSTNGNTADSAQTALGRGFIVMSNALDNSGHNCNVALQAESLEMTKEHVIKSYGTLKFTIGEGCSGGSLAAQQVANAYPGIYQGITVTCSFPDAWSTASQFIDYHLLLAYFGNSAKWGSGVLWTPVQEAAVEGNLLPLNALVSEAAQWHVAVPTDACAGTTTTTRYNARTNPRGVRCDIQDAAVNLFGRNPKSKWSRAERAAGYGFALPPIDNEGVQYGLSALKQGLITPAMFVDLNKKIGGVNIDTNPTASRITMGVPALANAYRSGAIDEANNLGQTAIIDCRGPDPGLFHDAYRAFAVRARLDRAYGSHANQLIWEGPVPILGDTNCMVNAFTAMDRWLDAVVADKSAASLVHKIAVDKPGDLSDRCYAGVGIKFTDALCGQLIVPLNGTPRTVAGDAITTDANKCHLKPFNAASYGSGFSTSDLGTLKRIFATGVCDFRKPGVDQQGTVPWQTYQTATGAVIYGGRKMPAVPRSVFAAS